MSCGWGCGSLGCGFELAAGAVVGLTALADGFFAAPVAGRVPVTGAVADDAGAMFFFTTGAPGFDGPTFVALEFGVAAPMLGFVALVPGTAPEIPFNVPVLGVAVTGGPAAGTGSDFDLASPTDWVVD